MGGLKISTFRSTVEGASRLRQEDLLEMLIIFFIFLIIGFSLHLNMLKIIFIKEIFYIRYATYNCCFELLNGLKKTDFFKLTW